MTAKVVEWRDSRSETPRAADVGVTVLRALLTSGRLRGKVTRNAAEGIPQLYRSGARSEIIWTADDIARFEETALKLGYPHVVDGLRLAAFTGLRRADLVTLTFGQVGEFAIEKRALKKSAGKRRRVTIPRMPSLDRLLDDLRSRKRKPGVETVLVNSFGAPWQPGGFTGAFNRIRDAAKIEHVDEATGATTRKHLHDVRGTFCTRLIVEAGLSNIEAAEIMGWAPERVASIRRMYVDQSAVVRAIGEKLRSI